MRDQARAAILSAIQTGWASAPPIEMVYSTDERTSEEKTPWGRASIQIGDTNAAAVGDRHVRAVAVLFVQVFLPEKTGTKAAFQTADKLDDLLRFQRIPVADVAGWDIHLESEGGCKGPLPAGKREGYDQMQIQMTFRLEAINTP